jgi:SAM-dependent methyltransferase
MNPQEILKKKEDLIRRLGPWTAHNVHLGGEVYTIDHKVVGQEIVLRRNIQIIEDIAHRPIKELRVLDLACLEGIYGIELALRGANVVGIEGRASNLEKARFVKEILGLKSLELYQADVRHINAAKYGVFDVVICAGILYHLDTPDVFNFVERIYEMCSHFSIFDTHVSIAPRKVCIHDNRKYFGRSFSEHKADSRPDQKAKQLWASLDNVNSFWFTMPSLLNLLCHTGFTSVYQCHNPSTVHDWADRVTLVAIKGTREPLLSSPLLNSVGEEDWPEKPVNPVHRSQQTRIRLLVKRLSKACPGAVKRFLKKVIRKSPVNAR